MGHAFGRSIEGGIEAKEYVERMLVENGNQMIIETKKLGKCTIQDGFCRKL